MNFRSVFHTILGPGLGFVLSVLSCHHFVEKLCCPNLRFHCRQKLYRDQFGEFVCGYWGLKGFKSACKDMVYIVNKVYCEFLYKTKDFDQ